MELIIITWLCISHIIYMVTSLRYTNSIEEINLSSLYCRSLSWPLTLTAAVVVFVVGLLCFILDAFGRIGEYLTDIYWDYDIFMSFLMQYVADQRRKP